MKTPLKAPFLLWVALLLLAACERTNLTTDQNQTRDAVTLEEASGLVTKNDTLYIISDDDPYHYYKYPANLDTGLFQLQLDKLIKVGINGSKFPAYDLESIEFLEDGRMVVLSERLRMLIDQDGAVVTHYEDVFDEIGGVGLEGLAVRKSGLKSEVAVLWEGGFMSYKDLPQALKDGISENQLKTPLHPRIIVHQIASNASTNEKLSLDSVYQIEVKPPIPQSKRDDGIQRFRASDLVWYKLNETEWGFIVLISSTNPANKAFEFCWLQRFDMRGNPIGKPFDIYLNYPKPDQANWEGMDWLSDQETLVLIHDKYPKGTPHLLIVPIGRL